MLVYELIYDEMSHVDMILTAMATILIREIFMIKETVSYMRNNVLATIGIFHTHQNEQIRMHHEIVDTKGISS